ncbi:MAG: family 1 glycosylhydrolase [Spirochaetota bacterium]
MPDLALPTGFLLGAASGAHQVEGDNRDSDWWLLEHHPAMAGKLVPSGKAIDQYSRYREDMALLGGLGFNAYRFSIEWARIEPERGVFSRSAIDHYKDVLDCVISQGMTPVVTLHHFTHPAWVALGGERLLPELPELFARYCGRIARELGDRISWLCTINEANILGVMRFVLPGMGSLFAGDRSQFLPFALLDSFETVTAAHRRAREAIKAERGTITVGWTLAASPIMPLGSDSAPRAAELSADLLERYYEVSLDDDFVGIQAYQRHVVDTDGRLVPPGADEERDGQGRRFDPEALELALRRAWDLTGKPLLVTENGICSDDDSQRIRFIDRALAGVRRCLEGGIDLRGYLHWTAFDNYEWGSYEHKFGLVGVDRHTLAREPKPSARHLGSYAPRP